MPLYTYECSGCCITKDEFRKLAERNDAPSCDMCAKPMVKIIGGHNVVGDFDPYYDDNLQAYVRSKQHRRQLMKEQDVSEKYGKGWI
jgi:putative FmdB family regulatory protein